MSEGDETKILEQQWGDVCLRRIAWTNEGRDLALAVRFPGSDTSAAQDKTLHCCWASNLEVEFTFKENEGGMPLTWDGTFERSEGGWKIELRFAGSGRIGVRCSEMKLTE